MTDQSARSRAGRLPVLWSDRGIRWFHLGAIHVGFADHRLWPRFHSDRKWRTPHYWRLHLGPWCLRLRIGRAHVI